MKQPKPPAKSTDRKPLADLAEVPSPARPGLWAAVVFALCTLALCYPAFQGKFLAMPWSDQYIAGYAFRNFGVESLRSGAFAQWNPYLFGGMPFIAAMHGDIFYPTAFLRLLLSTGPGMTWGFAIHLFLAGSFTYAFMRKWHFGFFPSVVAGVAYMLSGQLAGLASPGHDGKLFVSALLPLALYMLTRGIRDGKLWAWGGLSIAIGLGVLSPHPQLLQYLLLTSGAFALYLAFATHEGQGKLATNVAVRRLGLALGAVIIGAMIGGVQFMPVREYVSWSPRVGGRDYAYATTFSQPIEEFTIDSYLPQFSGMLDSYWGRNGIHLHSEYLGAVILFLAIAAIGVQGQRGFRRFWFGAFVIGVLWSLGGNTPFYRIVYAIVPGTHYFRAPSTIYFVYAFAVAIFAAFGARRLLAGQISTKYASIWVAVSAGIAVIMSAGGAAALSRVVLRSMAATQAPDHIDEFVTAYMDQSVVPNLSAVSLGGWRSFLFIAVAAGLVWLINTRRIPLKAAAWSIIAIAAIDLWSVERSYWQFSAPASEIYATDPAIDQIRSATQPGRVVAIAGTDLEQNRNFYPAANRDPLFFGSGFMAHDVRDLTGYHGNELHRYQMLFGASADLGYQPPRMLDPIVWRHENVQFLYTTLPDTVIPQLQAALKLTAPFTKLVGPVRDASGSTVYLYRVPGTNPFAWVASGAVRANDDQSFSAVNNAQFDPSRAALVDSDATIPVIDPAKLPLSSNNTTKVASYAPGRISIDLAEPAAAGSVLVVSENYFPGWTATSGSEALPTSRANFNLIGVGLTTGTKHVDLSFTDPAYGRGKLLTLFGLIVAIGAWGAGLIMEHRRPAPAASA